MNLDAALGRTWRDDAPEAFLRSLCELDDRMAGHPGEARAAALVADAFETAGVRDVTRTSFPLTVWTRGETTLRVTDPVDRAFEALALPYSPGATVEGRLVDVGHGTHGEIAAADLDGAVALARTDSPADGRFVHRMESFGHAIDAGAEAFLFRNHVDGQLPPTGSLRFDEPARAPGVGVSKESGTWLADYADRGARVALDVDATIAEGHSEYVHGVLGPADADREVVVVAHFDAHDVAEGALDNGCGIAVAVALARTLGRLDAANDLDVRVRVAGVGAEEVGLRGGYALADALDLEDVQAVVNVDGAGRHRDMTAMSHGSDDLDALLNAVGDRVDHPIETETDPHPWSDHWPFLRAGVPAVQLYSDSGDRGRGWGHTAADTFDKTDSRIVREHAMLATLLVLELADADVARIDDAALRDAMIEQGFDSGMQAAGIWPTEWTR
ncbi:M28 family peptidase [Halorubellus sp. JP-L1]|uniref:M28 family peptidase n=1 Tax=Halorubellus sp. JP-L1 TaxID=2715753 RepID=UPI00140C810B|nr:M28 family metallopeptidase [Halorubellus sp. JP-L1]NHN42041.1 M28 family peptidase [Halorubellus sp. JP-L1]